MRTRAIGWSNELHERLIEPVREGAILGPTWQQLFAPPAQRRERRPRAGGARGARSCWRWPPAHDCAYVYDPQVMRAAAQALQRLESVDRVLYAMKANPNAQHPAAAGRRGRWASSASRAARSSICSRACRGCDREPHPVHAEFRRRATNTPGRSSRTSRSRSTICSCCANGASCSAAAAYSFASIPAPAAGIITTCAPPARTPSSACRSAQLDELGAAGRALRRERGRPARAFRQRHLRCRQLVGGGERGCSSWRSDFRSCATIDVGGGLGVPDGHDQPALDLAQLDTALLGGARRAGPALRCGSSRGATWWRRPAR